MHFQRSNLLDSDCNRKNTTGWDIPSHLYLPEVHTPTYLDSFCPSSFARKTKIDFFFSLREFHPFSIVLYLFSFIILLSIADLAIAVGSVLGSLLCLQSSLYIDPASTTLDPRKDTFLFTPQKIYQGQPRDNKRNGLIGHTRHVSIFPGTPN